MSNLVEGSVDGTSVAPADSSPALPRRRKVEEQSLKDELERKATANRTFDKSKMKILEDLGSGFFGHVYKVDYEGEIAAVKMISSFDKEALGSYRREAQVMRGLKHPNIIQFYGTCEGPNEFYLMMEYAPNGSLRRLLKDTSIPLDWNTRIMFAFEVARAMRYLHSRRIMHRDLKCKNLLLTESNRVKICDFGLSRPLQSGRPMTLCGTTYWMAPEVIFGAKYDLPADVFSYGIVLVELLTRLKPDPDVITRTLPMFGIDVACLRALTPADCPQPFFDLAIACCNVEPEKRPTFKEIVAQLSMMLPVELRLRESQAPDVPIPEALSASLSSSSLFSTQGDSAEGSGNHSVDSAHSYMSARPEPIHEEPLVSLPHGTVLESP